MVFRLFNALKNSSLVKSEANLMDRLVDGKPPFRENMLVDPHRISQYLLLLFRRTQFLKDILFRGGAYFEAHHSGLGDGPSFLSCAGRKRQEEKGEPETERPGQCFRQHSFSDHRGPFPIMDYRSVVSCK